MDDEIKTEPVSKDQFKLIGTYKLKDKPGRDIVAFKIMPDMEGVVIQKVKGQSSKIIVAVKIIKPADGGAIPSLSEVKKTEEIKNEEKPKT